MKYIMILLVIFLFACSSPEERQEVYVSNHPNLRGDIKTFILEGKIMLGMTKEQVIASWGEPEKYIFSSWKKPKSYKKKALSYEVDEQWIYEHRYYSVYFSKGKVVSMRSFY